jgi:hypothetical protein
MAHSLTSFLDPPEQSEQCFLIAFTGVKCISIILMM